jgi:hypothetical protein
MKWLFLSVFLLFLVTAACAKKPPKAPVDPSDPRPLPGGKAPRGASYDPGPASQSTGTTKPGK